jgi:L-threonylcarbamoyladenylate synthase
MTSSAEITTDIDKAVNVLMSGGLVGMPTETVYGLAALATDAVAVKKVFDVKGRPYHHPLIVHVPNIAEAMKWGLFSTDAVQLATAFWPGPLTLLLPRTPVAPNWVTGGRDTVAIRVPDHPVAQEFLTKVGSGVVAPSANKFGKVSPTLPQHVVHDLGGKIDMVLDGGECSVGVESTIVECIDDATQILRQGGVTREQIEQVLHRSIITGLGESRAPGMMKSHYAPNARVFLFETLPEAEDACAEHLVHHRTCRVVFHEDVHVYAHHLYQDLRQADLDDISTICAVLPPRGGIGDAVRERLGKAAAADD